MAKTKYDERTRDQISSDVLKEKGLFGAIGTYLSGDFPRSESLKDPQGRVIRRQKGMDVLKRREEEGKKRAARLKKEKERQIAKNEEARKERIRASEQAKIDRQAASVSGRALNADEKKAIADMKRRERLAQADSAKASTGVLRSSANPAKPKPPAKPKVPAKTASTSTKPAAKSTPTSSTPASSGPDWKQYKSVAAAKRAGSRFYAGRDGKKKLAITKEELGRKKGETLTQAYNRFEGKTARKTANKAGGGMMKSKMASKGGARGGKRMPAGMKRGGEASKKFPDLSGDGKVTQKDILMGKGVVKKQAGGMMKSKGMAKGGAMKKKGYAMGGMTKKGMAKGGAMKKKGYSNGGAVRKSKPRGVGAALRGYGKAMK